MTDLKFSQLPKTLLIALTFMGTSFNAPLANSSTLALAESATPEASREVQNSQSEQRRQSVGAPRGRGAAGTYAQDTPPRPPVGAPGGRRQDAGSRGICPRVEQPLTALIPETSGYVRGLTATESPTFWFYVPYALTPETSVEFVLQDDDQNIIYQTSFTKAGTKPGVVGVQLPPSAPRLEVGKQYYWYFLVFCGDQETPATVEGWVERVALNPQLKRKLEGATPQESIALYADHDIWYEAVTALAKLRQEHPQDAALRAKWNELLKSVDLEALAQAPIVGCCTLNE